MGSSVLTLTRAITYSCLESRNLDNLVFAKWKYVIQAARAIHATYKKHDNSRGYHLSCREWCDYQLCTPPSHLPIYCFLLSVMHLGMLGSISFRIYADNFYGEPMNSTALVNSMLNKNTLGVKKVRGQSEAALQTGATKNFDIS